MYFASNMPHYPYQGDTKWLEHYQNVEHPRNLYAAFLSTLDERVGQLLNMLEAHKLRDNTIIVYQSDNGFSKEQRAHFGGGSSGPYRGEKFSMFEGGIRLPAIISWPQHLPQNATRDQVAHACDWLPTLAELCDVPLPKTPLDGMSLVNVLSSADAASPHQELAWNTKNQWSIRSGPWKLIHRVQTAADDKSLSPADKQYFLVNLEEDVSETKNLAAEHPQVVQRLRQRFESTYGVD